MRVRELNRDDFPRLANQFNLGRRWEDHAIESLGDDAARAWAVESDTGASGFVRARLVEFGRARAHKSNGPDAEPESIIEPHAVGVIEQIETTPDATAGEACARLLTPVLAWLLPHAVREVQITLPWAEPAKREQLKNLGFEPSRYLLRKSL